MKANEKMNRRDFALNAAAAATGLAGLATNAKPAFAKAGEFTKISFFGAESQSSPYQEGGPKAGKEATFGYEKQEKIVRGQGENIEKKIWWLVRDNLRGEAYTMKDNMKAINFVSKDQKKSRKAYERFWAQIDAVDLACVKKKEDLAQAEYNKAIFLLDEWKSIAM